MRYRKRFFIPYFSLPDRKQVGHLIWHGDGMEAHTADGHLVGKFPTRRDAAKALWAATGQPKKWTSHNPNPDNPDTQRERPNAPPVRRPR
jgi:hypothetical protein